MFIHYNNGQEQKLIKNVLCVDIIDGNEPAVIQLKNGKELRVRIDRIESIVDDEVIKESDEG